MGNSNKVKLFTGHHCPEAVILELYTVKFFAGYVQEAKRLQEIYEKEKQVFSSLHPIAYCVL